MEIPRIHCPVGYFPISDLFTLDRTSSVSVQGVFSFTALRRCWPAHSFAGSTLNSLPAWIYSLASLTCANWRCIAVKTARAGQHLLLLNKCTLPGEADILPCAGAALVAVHLPGTATLGPTAAGLATAEVL